MLNYIRIRIKLLTSLITDPILACLTALSLRGIEYLEEDIKKTLIFEAEMYEKWSTHRLMPYEKYPILAPSQWPILIGFALLVTAIGAVGYLHCYILGKLTLVLGLLQLIMYTSMWWLLLASEAPFLHTAEVRQNLRTGMLLFIVSEIAFFFSFFWAFFHSSLIPAIEIGGIWPPVGLRNLVIQPLDIPLLNTLILLLSGVTVTWAHHAIRYRFYTEAFNGLVLTIVLAFFFTSLQLYEYIEAEFTISDGIYGSVFYILTGFHGFHVIIGTIFLIVCTIRLWSFHFHDNQYVGLDCAIWYWHFVDVVWLFLFIFVYIWGNGL